MKRREWFQTMIGASLLPAAAAAQAPGRLFPPPARRTDRGEMPNVLWICADQQRYDTIQGLNNPHIRTPVLNKLMDQGVAFSHAFVQCPVCSPSRASFLTGRYPHTTGLRANGQRIRESERLVTRILADFGYACGLAGKLHLSPCANGLVEDRIDDGYRQFWWSHDLSDSWPGKNMWRVWLQSQGVQWPKTPPHTPAWPVPIDRKYTHSAWCCDRAIDFIRQQRTFRPWLMSVNLFQPHEPFWPAKEYYDRYDPEKLPSPKYHPGELDNKTVYQRIDHEAASGGRNLSFAKTDDLTHRKITAAYYAMIEQIDFEVGRVLQALEDTGQADNTIVIYMSDHGEMLGDHGIYLKGPHFYDCAVRVPLLIRWPGQAKAGLRSDALVQMTDITPTLLDAAGIPIPQGVQGRSLAPLLRGDTNTHRDSVYVEFYDASHLFEPPPMATSVRTRNRELTVYHSLKTGELYDLENDPGEFRNLWDDPNARGAKEELLFTLANRMAETIDPLPARKSTF